MLIDNTRVPFTDIAAANIWVRYMLEKKYGELSWDLSDYDKLGLFIVLFLNNTSQTKFVLQRITRYHL
jgi:hypothetical protein